MIQNTISHDIREHNFSPEIHHHWQQILDLIAELCQVPVALIMKVTEKEIEVFARSSNSENPYKVGAREELKGELYCETVIETRRELLVPNALADENWKNNPDVSLNMISYLGLPLCWPSGEIFGTICLLDNKANSYNATIRSLIAKFRDSVEISLAAISLNEELEQKNKALEDAITQKNEILGIVAHDMRNPINIIESSLEIMDLICTDCEIKGETFSPRNMLRKATRTVNNLLTDILEAEHLDTGTVEIRKESFDLIELVNAVEDNYRKILKQKNLELVKTHPEQCLLEAERMRIYQVLDNLVSNAAKYSPPGRKIYLAINQLDRNAIVILVEDEGPGMKPRDKEKIFGKFQKLSARPTANEPSSGLGLFIVEKIVQLHGGNVAAENREAGGCRFTVVLPIR